MEGKNEMGNIFDISHEAYFGSLFVLYFSIIAHTVCFVCFYLHTHIKELYTM